MFSSDIPVSDTPVIEMLLNCYNSEKVSFHMPGHTRGICFSGLHNGDSGVSTGNAETSAVSPESAAGKSGLAAVCFDFLTLDTTEFELTDDINNPTGPVKKAQVLAAKAFDAFSTFFVTAGSTIAIHAALLSTTKPGDKIIVFRNAHKSVINACIMYGLKLVYTSQDNLSETLAAHNDAVLVFLTRPDYYGRCLDIAKIADAVHREDKLLIVDEAHGTHFHFCPSLLPESAITAGGDIVVQSAHKTSPALTQGAFLHVTHTLVNSGRFPRSDIEAALQESLSMVTTSSPSFLIAASLDFARAYLSKFGERKTYELFDNIRHFYTLLSDNWRNCLSEEYRDLLNHGNEYRVLSNHGNEYRVLANHEDENHPLPNQGKVLSSKSISVDLFRIVLNLKNMPLSTNRVCSELAANGIYVEFHDALDIVLICKFGNTPEDFARLAGVLNKMDQDANGHYKEVMIEKSLPVLIDNYYRDYSKEVYDFSIVRNSLGNVEEVPIENCAGRVLYSGITPYPPGVPLILPGETISFEAQQILIDMMKCDMNVNGLVVSIGSDANKIAFVKCIKL